MDVPDGSGEAIELLFRLNSLSWGYRELRGYAAGVAGHGGRPRSCSGFVWAVAGDKHQRLSSQSA